MKYTVVLLAIILLSLIFRFTIPPDLVSYSGITEAYREIGANLSSGQGYVVNGAVPMLYYTPGYAYLWALHIPSLALWLDGILGPILLYAVLRKWPGLFAALLYASAFPIIRVVTYQLPDSLTSILSLMVVCPILIWRNWRGAALSGLALGIALWLRSDFMALVPLLALVILFTLGIRSILAYAVAWLIPATALGLFFMAQYGAFSLTRSGAGLNLWEGLGEYPNPWGIVCSDDQAGELLSTNGLQYGTAAGDNFLQRQYLHHLAENPMIVIGQIAARFWHTATLQDMGLGIIQWIILISAAIGFYLARTSPVTGAFTALWLSRVVPFSILHVEPRYVLPVFAVYIIGVGLLANVLADRLRRVRRKSGNKRNLAVLPEAPTTQAIFEGLKQATIYGLGYARRPSA